jgi:hypothetical protein
MSGSAELPIHKRLLGYCICGHSADAHGSNGIICAVCICMKFERKEEDGNRKDTSR